MPKNSLRVLLWCTNFWPALGGLEKISGHLALALKALAVQIEVLCPHHPDRPESDNFEGIPVHRLPFSDYHRYSDPDFLFGLQRRIRKIHSDLKPDLIHISGCDPSLLFHLLSNKADIPTLVTLHGAIVGSNGTVSGTVKKALTSAKWLCCCSQWTLNHVRQVLPETQACSSTLVNALPFHDLTLWKRPAHRQLFCAARLSREKGFDVAIRALAKLDETWSLRIGGSGPLLGELQQLSQDLGLSRRVTFLGRLSEEQVGQEMLNSLAVLIPSTSEGFGLVALEAHWRGVPVIASDIGGLPEVVLHGQTGFLVPPQDPEALARAIGLLPGSSLETLSAVALKHVRQSFCWPEFVQAYHRIYLKLAGVAN